MRRTAIDLTYLCANENVLRQAKSLEEIRSFAANSLAATSKTEGTPRGSQPRETPEDTAQIMDQVGAAIEDRRKITLRRLVMTQANSLAKRLASPDFPASGATTNDALRGSVASYLKTTSPFLPSLGLLGYWGGRLPNALAVEAIDRLANSHEKNPLENGTVALLALRRYPVLLAIYAAGVAAVAGENYRGLFGVLRDTTFYEHGQTKRRLWTELAYWGAENRELWNRHILGRDLYFPVSQVLEHDLREPLESLTPSQLRYVENFDRFEFFASLDHFLFTGRAMGASFLWRRQRESNDTDLLTEMRAEAAAAGAAWPPLKEGLLKGTGKTNVLDVLDEFRKSVEEVKNAYHVW